jgi:hypothetical protein
MNLARKKTLFEKGKLVAAEIPVQKNVVRLVGQLHGFSRRRILHSNRGELNQTLSFSKTKNSSLRGQVVVENQLGTE